MKPLKLDADSSRTGKLEDMNAPWSRLLHLATRYTYPKRYPLVLAGDDMFDFYYLAKGRLRIMHGAENGRERAMVYIGSGNVFNEATALAGFDDPDCRFYCMEDVELYRFPGTLLHDPRFVAEYPELIINLMVSMSTKVLVMHANLSETGGGTAVKQVSLFLCGLSRLHGDKLDFNPQMTQEELAIFLGMHRATLVRALRVLRGCGALLQLTKNRLRIGDLALLQKIAGE